MLQRRVVGTRPRAGTYIQRNIRQFPLGIHRNRPLVQHRRAFRSTSWCGEKGEARNDASFHTRLGRAWRATKIEWKPIPVGLGVGFLGAVQFWRVRARQREEADRASGTTSDRSDGNDEGAHPGQRGRNRDSGPWQVQVMSTLPLKAISRWWGRFNELTIPYYLRVPGFKLYGWIFGVNFEEVSEPDLHAYPNLAAFFYRTLKPGVRPLDPNPNAILSPADGKILSFGTIEHGQVEQVKGITYSLDGLLGKAASSATSPPHKPNSSPAAGVETAQVQARDDKTIPDKMSSDQEFANMNGIPYTLPDLFSGQQQQQQQQQQTQPESVSYVSSEQYSEKGSQFKIKGDKLLPDASTTPRPSSEAQVRADLALSPSDAMQQPQPSWWNSFSRKVADPTPAHQLHFAVVYLAPGDYHRFHSPVPWVCASRRHFAGDLYSVSPYLQRTLPGLFTLNERVVLLGRWRHGFFSMVPVGATNVGSIKINFDAELRTNSLTTATAADRDAENRIATASASGTSFSGAGEGRKKNKKNPYTGFSEATYEKASALLGGYALKRGEEMGGFQLGSSIILVFEAPPSSNTSQTNATQNNETNSGRTTSQWVWNVQKGQRVKVGEAIGWVEDK